MVFDTFYKIIQNRGVILFLDCDRL